MVAITQPNYVDFDKYIASYVDLAIWDLLAQFSDCSDSKSLMIT